MSDTPPPSPREHLALLAAWGPRLLRFLWVGGVVLAAGLIATAAWALSRHRLYRSEAVIVFDRGVQSGALGSVEGEQPRQLGSRLQDMLMSRQRLEKVVNEKKLYPAIVEQRSLVEAADELRSHVAISAREGYTFRVTYDGESRELAQQVLDALLKGVVKDDTARRLHEAEQTKEFLDTERKHADEDLKAKEGALSAFLTQHPQLARESGGAASAGGLIRANMDNTATVSGGEIASLEMQAAQLEEAIAAAARTPGGPSADPTLVGAHARAEAELQAAQRDLADKQARFTNEHPDVKVALRRVADAQAGVHRAEMALSASRAAGTGAGTVVERREGEDEGGGKSAALRRALAAVRAQLGSLRSRSSAPRLEVPRGSTSVVEIDTSWTRLNRDVVEARERQSQLEGKQFQAQLAATLVAGGQGGRLVIADPPFRPLSPIAGGRFKIALVGGVLAVGFAMLVVVLLAAFDDRLYDARDVGRVAKDGIVVVIPRLTSKGG